MEGLNNMVKTSKLNEWIKGFEMARNGSSGLEVTYLQYKYADDTLIFCDAEEEKLRFLRVILVLFEVSLDFTSIGGRAFSFPSVKYLRWSN